MDDGCRLPELARSGPVVVTEVHGDDHVWRVGSGRRMICRLKVVIAIRWVVRNRWTGMSYNPHIRPQGLMYQNRRKGQQLIHGVSRLKRNMRLAVADLQLLELLRWDEHGNRGPLEY